MNLPSLRIEPRRRLGSGGVPGNDSEAIGKHQQGKDPERQRNTQRQGLHGPVALAPISNEKEKPGKQAADDSDQHEDDDELEHGSLRH